ncbi:MAG: hypothetical protein JJU27_02810 [Gammaproteobacteria bacterium]|nr:hypothetical protein [Gammaproteobacteria bacterium]
MFVPASGPAGSGEYYRCLAIARALRRRRPDCVIHFACHRDAGVERDAGMVYHLLDDTPTRQTQPLTVLLAGIAPDLVVFDSAGRQRLHRAARQVARAIVWISDRPNKRRRGFRFRAMPNFDLHLIAAPGIRCPRLTLRERLKRRFAPHLAIRFFSGIAPEPACGDPSALLEPLGLAPGGYLAFVAGGGGYRHGGRPVPEILVDAAAEARRRTGLKVVVVMGPQYQGTVRAHAEVTIVHHLATEALTALLASSRAAVIGAGSMMVTQALAAGVAVVLVPAGGDDQPARIRYMEAHGMALAAPMRVDAIVMAAARLAESAELRDQQAAAAQANGLRNDVDTVASALLELL